MKQINNYAEFVKASRSNVSPPDFPFTIDMFENLIDCWTPQDQFPSILQTSFSVIDNFCRVVYHMDFNQTYSMLSGITDAFMRKTFKNLASSGNPSAISIVSKHFMKLDDSNSNNLNVTFVNDLKEDN